MTLRRAHKSSLAAAMLGALLLIAAVQPAHARIWACTAALALDDTRVGQSDTRFHLQLVEGGVFFAVFANAPGAPFPRRDWSGQWIIADGRMAMIGQERLHWPRAATQVETRAHSTLIRDGVMILELVQPEATRLVRCLKEPL